MDLVDYISFGESAYNLFKDCIIMLSLQYEIHYANPSVCSFLQFEPAQLILKPIEYISKDLAELIKDINYSNSRTLRTMSPANISFADKYKHIFMTTAYILTLDNQNGFVGFMIVFQNPLYTADSPSHFDQRVSLVNALNLKSDEFCYIANIAEGRNVFVSKSSEKFVGWKVQDLMSAAFAISKQHPDDMWIISNFYKKRLRWFNYPGKFDHIALQYKYRMMHKNGHYVQLKISIMLLERDENGAPKYTICFGKTYEPKNESAFKNNSILTRREKEVLQALAEGRSYKMVASELNISIDSVRTYTRRIYQKLNVHSVTEAIHKVTLHI